MIKDIRKLFNRERNVWTNHQVLGMRQVFRGVAVKIWVALPLERMFSECVRKCWFMKHLSFVVNV